MAGPKNASQNAGGFRFYDWQVPGEAEPRKLLSVTSIRKLCGESYQLVAWQIGNVINAAMGTTKRTKIGPRGGVSISYVKDGEFPGQFITRMLEGKGTQASLDAMRKWLRSVSEEPRDTAAVRGTLVHEAAEIGATLDKIDRTYIEHAVGRLSAFDQKKIARGKATAAEGVTDDDVAFVRACVANYWDMRVNVPYVILAREPQVFNLTAGYGGSADVLLWFLPEGTTERARLGWQTMADKGQVFQSTIEEVGGFVCLGDYKTSKGMYTDQVVQVHAYLAAEFVGRDGVVDERLTAILRAADQAALIHLRPNKWAVHFVDFEQPVLLAFLGSVAFARFLATYPEPYELFTHDRTGAASISMEDPD